MYIMKKIGLAAILIIIWSLGYLEDRTPDKRLRFPLFAAVFLAFALYT